MNRKMLEAFLMEGVIIYGENPPERILPKKKNKYEEKKKRFQKLKEIF